MTPNNALRNRMQKTLPAKTSRSKPGAWTPASSGARRRTATPPPEGPRAVARMGDPEPSAAHPNARRLQPARHEP
eukprot:4301204-Lingulodinium_polyedra.AAC.1